ncbi:SdrD B-like domain-containing protein [Polaromonas aquatica]|uniref:SdrD B-like domain-containing protein n=1 Tax=Polaromonas aquatica TaxID=332657 RepID=UPI003D64D444
MKRQAHTPTIPSSFLLKWWRIGLLGLSGGFAAAAALAQATPATPDAGQPYVDRVIEGLPDPDSALQLKSSEYNEAGWPRSWRVDYSLFRQTGGGDTTSRALGLGGFVDTPNHGALSINANLVQQQSSAPGNQAQNSGSTWRIDQRALPLDGGWFANHNAGDINTVSTRLARGMGRVSVPATPIRGVGGQWYLNDSIDLNAAAGRTGLFSGLDAAGFQTSGGSIGSVGAQFRLPLGEALGVGGRSDAALQLIDGKNISDGGSGSVLNTRAYFAAASWEGAAPWGSGLPAGYGSASERVGGLRMQANVVQSEGSREGGATGLWMDAAWRTERWRNAAGVFRFEPNLRWGTTVLASDLQGLYWQADTSTRQWQAGFAVELSDSVSRGGSTGSASGRSAFLNLNGRYLLDSRNSVGAALSFRTITSPGQSAQLSWNRTSDWGQTQWRADLANASGIRTTRFGVDQSWPVAVPATFGTSLAWERMSGNISPTTGLIWGILGTLSPWSQWSIDGAVRGAQRSDGGESVNANIGVSWQPYGGWSLSLRYTESRGQEPLPALVVSALTAATLQTIPTTQTNRSIQLLLRYEDRAGTATAPLGGLPGTGSGGLTGAVFYDADGNGRREASEAGVPGVTVILDRRYVTRTDGQGRYEFPFVAAGEHLIEVSPDNVPLPWSPALRDPAKTVVFVRQTHSLDFAVQRER